MAPLCSAPGRRLFNAFAVLTHTSATYGAPAGSCEVQTARCPLQPVSVLRVSFVERFERFERKCPEAALCLRFSPFNYPFKSAPRIERFRPFRPPFNAVQRVQPVQAVQAVQQTYTPPTTYTASHSSQRSPVVRRTRPRSDSAASVSRMPFLLRPPRARLMPLIEFGPASSTARISGACL